MSIKAVARIAYLSADAVVDSLPPAPKPSLFAATFASLQQSSSNKARVLSTPFGGDPGATVLQNANGLTVLTAEANAQTLTRILLHIGEISNLPVVLHLAVRDNLADVLLLRSSVPFFLLSRTAQEAHDHALLAARLARVEKKAVVHAFYVDTATSAIEIPEREIQPFLLRSRGTSSSPANGHSTEAAAQSAILFHAYETAAQETSTLLKRSVLPYVVHGPPDPQAVIVTLGASQATLDVGGVSFVSVNLANPLPSERINNLIPSSTKQVVVLEQVHGWHSKWTPLYLDVLTALQERSSNQELTVHSGVLGALDRIEPSHIRHLLDEAAVSPTRRLQLGLVLDNTDTDSAKFSSTETLQAPAPAPPHIPKHEAAYTKILAHLFQDRLQIANDPELVKTRGAIATTPEYALGRVRALVDARGELVGRVQDALQDGGVGGDVHGLLAEWVVRREEEVGSRVVGEKILGALRGRKEEKVSEVERGILEVGEEGLIKRSRWIVGSDAWSYDLGASGLHHAIASGLDVNILILDTLPYSARNDADPQRRKHDVGLYAMNHGDVFVASVAVFSSYSQVLQAIVEADRFKGPSVVLAYLPYENEDASALDVLKETKMAVDSGYWPLYRWDPSKEQQGKEPFSLDSDAVKNDLRTFLDRQNHLSQVSRSAPVMAAELVGSLGETVREARRKRVKEAYSGMLSALDAPPVLVLYASDGGAAEKKAKRLVGRAKARGLSTTMATMDAYTFAALVGEEYVVFVTSTAGQGEPPQNGRNFFKALNAAVAKGDKVFEKMKYAVFAMGDSHYWPRAEDAHYYNKPGKDLDARLEKLGGERIAGLGLGDDQDADGAETGYKLWEPGVWKALKVDAVEVTEAEPDPITNEHIKAASGFLRGTISEGLVDTSTGALAPSDTQLTKFHGIYQQDDRDIREEREVQGVEPAYSFMIRVRMPGGVCEPWQWLQMDQIADEHGNGTFKITTRATFQFHGVIKRHLKPAIKDINRALLDTLAACGDVNRNVICSAIPTFSKLHQQVFEFSKEVSEHLLPRTTAYHEIWLDKKLVAGEALKDFEPLYGEFYLPRKFKVAVAVPPTNDVDVFANDLGFIAVVDEKGELQGFNVTIGGGMGVTHGNKKTYPRLGSLIGFCTPEQGKYVAEKVMLVQRDNGNRVDRKNARLKYTIDRMGLDNYKAEVEKLLGYPLAPVRPFTFDRNIDDYGWHKGEDGRHHFMMFVENGRVQDEPGKEFKSGLREIAKVHKGTFRLTANQHLMISDVEEGELGKIKGLLSKYGMDELNFTGLRLSSSACVAFPTCGLAMAESERYLPLLVEKVEKICEENGLRNDSIVMRMTGCPNGCARPYVAEIAFVGKALGTYAMLLGGGYYGQRLNKIYRESVTEPEILAILRPMIKRYALERHDGERFGDWTIRAGYIAPTTEGRLWYEHAGGEGVNRENAVAA